MGNDLKISNAPRVPLGNLWLWWAGLLLYYCWFQALYNSLSFGEIFVYVSLPDFAEGFICNFVPIATVWWLYIGVVFRWIRIKDKLVKTAVDIVSASVIAVTVNLLYIAISPVFTGQEAVLVWSGTLLTYLLELMLIEMTYYFKSLILYQGEVENMEKQVVKHQYAALKAQVNPHFLFNSFNILYSLVLVDSSAARVFIQNLAEMYRYVLDRHGRNRVSAKEELNFVRSYIAVLCTRYRNKFSVKWTGTDIDSDFLSEVTLVPFTLQTLIENVVKHNVVSTRTPMEIEINISESGVTVSNPIHPRQTAPEQSSGFGLKYIASVYKEAERQFKITNETGNGIFQVYLDWLPAEADISEKNNEYNNVI